MADDLSVGAISHAAAKLWGVARQTPLEPSARLSAVLGVPVLLKREDLQLCRSYKVRGAYHMISSLGDHERRRGVVCASAGNHGQGVAYACRDLGIPGRVFLPTHTPQQKLERVASMGAGVIQLVIAGSDFGGT